MNAEGKHGHRLDLTDVLLHCFREIYTSNLFDVILGK